MIINEYNNILVLIIYYECSIIIENVNKKIIRKFNKFIF